MSDNPSDKMQSTATGPTGAITDEMAENALRMVKYGDTNYQRAVFNALNLHGKYDYARRIVEEYGSFMPKRLCPANCNEVAS